MMKIYLYNGFTRQYEDGEQPEGAVEVKPKEKAKEAEPKNKAKPAAKNKNREK